MFASTSLAARVEGAEARLIEDSARAAARRHPEAAGFITRIAGGVAAFRIGDEGKLDLLNTQPSMGQGPCHVSIDATGKCLLVANYSSGSVAALGIKEDGALEAPVSSQQHEGSSVHKNRQTGPHAHSIYPGPDNAFAYSPDLGIDKVTIHRLDAGKATLEKAGSAKVPPGSGPRHMKFGKDGKFAYVLNELLLTVSVFKRSAGKPGMLNSMETVSVLPDGADRSGMTCSEIRVHPSGKFAYTGNRNGSGEGRDSITVFKVCLESGKITRIQTAPAHVGVPRNFNIDPTGRWLIAGGQKSHDIAVFEIDPATGKLTFTGRKVPFEGGPICLEFLKK